MRALVELGLGEGDADLALDGVEGDHVAVAEERDRAALGRLGADVADAEAAGGAGEAAVGDQRHLLAHALAGEGGGGREHLAHAGAADRALVADDDDLALLVGALLHRVEGVLLALEDAGGAGEDLLRLGHAGDLHDGALGGEVAHEADDAAGLRDRLVDRVDHPAVGFAADVVELLADGAPARGDAVAVEEAGAHELLEHHRHAAGLEEVLGDVFAARLEVDEIGGVVEDVADVLEGELDPGLVGDRRQVQPAVGRAAGAGDDAGGVLEALAGHHVAGADVLLEEVHHRDAAGGRRTASRLS